MDLGKWDITVQYLVIRYPRVFRRLTVDQRTPRFWGVTVYFVLELRIFVMMESTNGVCYFCLLFCFKNVCDDRKH